MRFSLLRLMIMVALVASALGLYRWGVYLGKEYVLHRPISGPPDWGWFEVYVIGPLFALGGIFILLGVVTFVLVCLWLLAAEVEELIKGK